MTNAASMRDNMRAETGAFNTPTELNTLLLAMCGRYSSNPIDKVCSIAFPFQKRGSSNFHSVTFPIYDPNTADSVAWERLISSIASAKMDANYKGKNLTVHRTTTIQLLCLFPHPSRHHWFPSWTQLQQYPDVSVRDNDLVPVAGDMDYSLRIVPGRIYRGCSLELKQPPTSKGRAVYHCSMDSKLVELVATVPNIELDIDSRGTYVLVDISPDYSLWSLQHLHLHDEAAGHAHPPIWLKSVIIVCEDSLAQPVQATTGSPEILRYRLRRITTLEWDCRGPHGKHWLPFKPSLEHMRSVLCAREGLFRRLGSGCPPIDTFCDPAAVAGLPINGGRIEWDKCPLYEVYLV